MLLVWITLATFPFLWMFLISFRKPVDAFSTPPKIFAKFTLEHFHKIWVVDSFWVYALNSTIITIGTVTISMFIGCLAGYALSRYKGSVSFWLLIIALIFRAMPHVVLLTSYKPIFFELGI